MTKIDHSKGGRYDPDPARVQPKNDFDQPDAFIVKGEQPLKPDKWADALKAERNAVAQGLAGSFTQEELLDGLGIALKGARAKDRKRILKRLSDQSILLPNGKPNLDHPDVVEVIHSRNERR